MLIIDKLNRCIPFLFRSILTPMKSNIMIKRQFKFELYNALKHIILYNLLPIYCKKLFKLNTKIRKLNVLKISICEDPLHPSSKH